MLRDATFLAFADLRFLLRRREIWLWAFVLPVLFFYFVGTITANFSSADSADILAVAVPENAGYLAGHLIKRLETLGYVVVRVPNSNAFPANAKRLLIPAGFTQAVLDRKPVKLEYTPGDSGLQADYDSVRLQRAAYSVLADVVVLVKDGQPLDAVRLSQLDATPRTLTLESTTAGKRRTIPSGFEQAVPGSMVFFLLMVMLTSGAVTLVIEREQGILRRLASSPISRPGVVLGKWGARMLLAGIQITFCMITGSLLFHVHWGSNLPMVLVVLFAYASAAAAAGMLIGSLARTRAQAGVFGSLTANLLACIGACWWPLEIMPRAMQAISRMTPPGMTMDALHQLVNFGAEPAAVLPHVLGLGVIAVMLGALATRSFRFQ